MPPWWTHEDSGHQGLGRIPGLQCTSWGRPSPSHQTYPGPGPRPAPLRPAGSSGFLGVGPLPRFPGWLMPCPGGWAGADPSPARPSSRRGRPVSLRTPRAVLAGPLLRRAGSHQDPARIPPRRLRLRSCRVIVCGVFAGEMRAVASQSAIVLVSAEGVSRRPSARSDLANDPRARGKNGPRRCRARRSAASVASGPSVVSRGSASLLSFAWPVLSSRGCQDLSVSVCF